VPGVRQRLGGRGQTGRRTAPRRRVHRNLRAVRVRHVRQTCPTDAELQNGQADTAKDPEAGSSSRPPRNNRPVDGETIRYATASQVRAIRAICNRQGVDPRQLASDRFRVNDLEELTLREASSLIDELKAEKTNGRKGGGR
jgi:hypothetical protein